MAFVRAHEFGGRPPGQGRARGFVGAHDFQGRASGLFVGGHELCFVGAREFYKKKV